MSQIENVFGNGKEKSISFWHSIIRQIYVKQLITKEIESYGILKITSAGEKFIKNPSLIKKMGEKSRKIAEDKYDVHKVNKVIMNTMGLS